MKKILVYNLPHGKSKGGLSATGICPCVKANVGQWHPIIVEVEMEEETEILGTIDYSQSEKFRRGGRNFLRNYCKTLRAENPNIGVVMRVKVIGQMDNTIDHTFESANRVYDTDGLAPTVNTCSGGAYSRK